MVTRLVTSMVTSFVTSMVTSLGTGTVRRTLKKSLNLVTYSLLLLFGFVHNCVKDEFTSNFRDTSIAPFSISPQTSLPAVSSF
jgi:hypothetical protein